MSIPNIKLNVDAIEIVDQSLLPGETRVLVLKTHEQFYDAIKTLKVRGAPAIGIFAGYAVYLSACGLSDSEDSAFLSGLEEFCEYLNSSRPTAVNLMWATARMLGAAREHISQGTGGVIQALKRECVSIHDEDKSMCLAISENGLSLLRDGDGVLTHCNAGPLATSEYGTALGPLILAAQRGINVRVFADETRPLLQGARLTAYELVNAGVDTTLICDNMAGMVMKNGWIQHVFVGCDRIARNGDTANKIGTGSLAVLAAHYGIPFYVLGPSSTIDLDCASGADIEIELRDGAEITRLYYEKPMAPEEVKCYNPAFDVTDNRLITGIITQHGIIRPPFEPGLCALRKPANI